MSRYKRVAVWGWIVLAALNLAGCGLAKKYEPVSTEGFAAGQQESTTQTAESGDSETKGEKREEETDNKEI